MLNQSMYGTADIVAKTTQREIRNSEPLKEWQKESHLSHKENRLRFFKIWKLKESQLTFPIDMQAMQTSPQ